MVKVTTNNGYVFQLKKDHIVEDPTNAYASMGRYGAQRAIVRAAILAPRTETPVIQGMLDDRYPRSYQWRVVNTRGSLGIGCMTFVGKDARALKVWALRRRKAAK